MFRILFQFCSCENKIRTVWFLQTDRGGHTMHKLIENPTRLNELCSTVAIVGSTGFFLFVIALGMAQSLRGLV